MNLTKLTSREKLINFYLFLFFSAITFALYYKSLNNFYVLDDVVRLKAASQGSLSENFHFSLCRFWLIVFYICFSAYLLSPCGYLIIS